MKHHGLLALNQSLHWQFLPLYGLPEADSFSRTFIITSVRESKAGEKVCLMQILSDESNKLLNYPWQNSKVGQVEQISLLFSQEHQQNHYNQNTVSSQEGAVFGVLFR